MLSGLSAVESQGTDCFFGMIELGPRGIQRVTEPVDEAVDDFEMYGADFKDCQDDRIMAHLLNNNEDDHAAGTVIQGVPTHLSEVLYTPANFPLDEQQLQFTDEQIRGFGGVHDAINTLQLIAKGLAHVAIT